MTTIMKSLKYFWYALISSPSDIVCKFGIFALKLSKFRGGSDGSSITRANWNYENLLQTHLKRNFIAWFSQILILSTSDIIAKFYNLAKKAVHAKKNYQKSASSANNTEPHFFLTSISPVTISINIEAYNGFLPRATFS